MTVVKKLPTCAKKIRKRIAMKMDGAEEQFFIDSKPIEVCRVAKGKRCKMGHTGEFSKAPRFWFLCFSKHLLLWL